MHSLASSILSGVIAILLAYVGIHQDHSIARNFLYAFAAYQAGILVFMVIFVVGVLTERITVASLLKKGAFDFGTLKLRVSINYWSRIVPAIFLVAYGAWWAAAAFASSAFAFAFLNIALVGAAEKEGVK